MFTKLKANKSLIITIILLIIYLNGCVMCYKYHKYNIMKLMNKINAYYDVPKYKWTNQDRIDAILLSLGSYLTIYLDWIYLDDEPLFPEYRKKEASW